MRQIGVNIEKITYQIIWIKQICQNHILSGLNHWISRIIHDPTPQTLARDLGNFQPPNI